MNLTPIKTSFSALYAAASNAGARPTQSHVDSLELGTPRFENPIETHSAPARGCWGRRSTKAKVAIVLGVTTTVVAMGIAAGIVVPRELAILRKNALGIPPPLPSVLSSAAPPTATGATNVTFTPDGVPSVVTTSNAATPTASTLVVVPSGSGAIATSTSSAPAAASTPATALESTLAAMNYTVANDIANAGSFACVFTEHAVSITRAGLQMTVQAASFPNFKYECAQVQSQATYLYGRFSVDMQASKQPGVVSGAFTYTEAAPGIAEEIDMELTGKDTTKLNLNLWQDGYQAPATVNLGFDASLAMHNYAFEWTNTSVTWFVDGKQVHSATGNLPRAMAAPFIVNTWLSNPNDWAGQYDTAQTVPATHATFNNINYQPV